MLRKQVIQKLASTTKLRQPALLPRTPPLGMKAMMNTPSYQTLCNPFLLTTTSPLGMRSFSNQAFKLTVRKNDNITDLNMLEKKLSKF